MMPRARNGSARWIPETEGLTVSDSARAAASGAEHSDASRPTPKAKPGKGEPGLFGRIARFWRQVASELKKVVRPTRETLFSYVSAVLVFVLVVMIFITVVDLGAGTLVGFIFGG